MLRVITTILITGFLASCASIPKVTFSYYPGKWETVAMVTQTLGCSADKTRLVVHSTASIATTYSSDLNNPYEINIKDLQSPFADSDITMNFTDDGRLKSINQSSTGQGEAIVKSAMSLAAAAAAFSLAQPPVPLDECKIIENWGAGKPVSLTYSNKIDSRSLGRDVTLDPEQESKVLYDQLKNRLPKLTVAVSNISDSKSGPRYEAPSGEGPDNVVLIRLQKVGAIELTFRSDDSNVGIFRLLVPEKDSYQLPIPKPALFGTQKFALTLSEAGAVTSVGYTSNTGTAAALNALGAIAKAETDSTAAKAAALKAQADLIAQQQRLVLCETKPEECK